MGGTGIYVFLLFSLHTIPVSRNLPKIPPFHLLYGWEPRLLTGAVLDAPTNQRLMDTNDYVTRFSQYMDEAWQLAQSHIRQAQAHQKAVHDCHARPMHFASGDRIFIHMLSAKQGKSYKFVKTFHGPYCGINVIQNGVIIHPIDRPPQESVWVACPQQVYLTSSGLFISLKLAWIRRLQSSQKVCLLYGLVTKLWSRMPKSQGWGHVVYEVVTSELWTGYVLDYYDVM